MEQLKLPELDLSIFLNAELLKGYLGIYMYICIYISQGVCLG